MKSRKVSRKQMLSVCDVLGPEDGQDPRYGARSRPERRATRKARQLCQQVALTLQSVLAGECGDDLLRELTVLAVDPAPHAGRLLVTVGPADPATARHGDEVLERLQHAAGMLRSQVAAAVNRRRAPELVFRLATRD